MTLPERPTVAVIGGGFSGVLTALRLLEAPDGPCVRLVERRAFGRGAAYGTPDAEHLLNVRAANMSAFPEDADHFRHWLAGTDADARAAAFVSRGRYGDYLQAMLRRAAEHAPAARLILEADAAVSLRRVQGRWRVGMAMGRSFWADAVVLAIGNLPPHAPAGFDAEALASPAYRADPWAAGATPAPDEGLAVLLGTGLTMVDVASRLASQRPGLRMLAISRRRLLPRRHLETGPPPEPWAPTGPQTVRGVARELRRRAHGRDWRPVVDGLRPHVQRIWREWPAAERRRFLRHARPWWDVHRHRIAPAVAASLDHLTAGGRLSTAAGRIVAATSAEDEIALTWTPRGAREPQRLEAAVVVNCTGPQGDLARASDPLLRDLVAQGLVRADACGLGLDVDDDGRLKDAKGEASPTLYAVGPLTRGAFWEITSVPDIRVQAAAVASRLGETLGRLHHRHRADA